MSKTRLVGYDIETVMIVNQVAPQPVCITFYSKEDGEELHKMDTGVDRLKELLRDDSVHLVAQNANFDAISMSVSDYELFGLFTRAYSKGRIYCTKLAEILLNSADPAEEGKSRGTVFIDRGEDHPKRWKPASNNSLDGLAWKYLRVDLSADKESDLRKSYGDLLDVPLEEWSREAKEYAIGDARYCHDVLKAQGERARELADKIGVNVLRDLSRQAYVEFVLQFQATVFGVGVNVSKIDAAVEACMEIHDKEIATALQFGLYKANKNSDRGYSANSAKMGEMLQRAIDLVGVDHPRTAKGKLSTAKQALEMLYDSIDYALTYKRNLDHKLPLSDDDVAELASIQSVFKSAQASDAAWKEIGTFLKALRNASLNPDQRLRYKYSGLMETGRTSSSSPNLQNIPRKGAARSCIEANANTLFIISDFSNAELRTLAQAHLNEGRESRLASEYQKDPNFDPHLYMAVNILGNLTYAEGLAILGDKTHPRYKEVKETRQLSKIANFGYAGGLGSEQFIDYAKGYGVNLTAERSAQLRDEWLSTWTEMEDYFHVRGEMLRKAEEEDLLDRASTFKHSGKARRRKEVSAGDYSCVYKFQSSSRARYLRKFTIACNTPFQGIASDGAKDALILIWEDCFFNPQSPIYGAKPVLFVHDEIVLEYKFDGDTKKATAAAKRVQELMEQGMSNHTPDIPALAEPALSWEWTKDAESEWLEDGTLSIYGESR